MSNYVPTGYPRGRPRKGEIRPLSKPAKWQRKWRAENPELARKKSRVESAKWRAENPERYAMHQRNYLLRKKGWEEATEYRGLPDVKVELKF